MYGVECDTAFRAKFAMQLIRQRLHSNNPEAMYQLILIDHELNN